MQTNRTLAGSYAVIEGSGRKTGRKRAWKVGQERQKGTGGCEGSKPDLELGRGACGGRRGLRGFFEALAEGVVGSVGAEAGGVVRIAAVGMIAVYVEPVSDMYFVIHGDSLKERI